MSKEVLFAAVDNAATAAEWDVLLDGLESDPALKAEWSRVWGWRDANDGVQIKAADSFCSGVMAAIAAEPQVRSNVVSMAARRTSRLSKPALNWRTLVPLSAAAGVVAAVLFVGGLRTGPTEPAAVVALSVPSAPTTPTEVDVLPDAAKVAILNAYLMEHSNSLAERSMGGTLANARFAARTADYRPDAQ